MMMAKGERMLHGQFGCVDYQSGIIEPGFVTTMPTSNASAVFAVVPGGASQYMGVTRHDDDFYSANGYAQNVKDGKHFITYQYVDLRDMMTNHECMDDITINVQRNYDNPFPNPIYNMAPGQGIEETFTVVLGKMDLKLIEQDVTNNLEIEALPQAGMQPARFGGLTGETLENGLPNQILYREVRRYFSDPSQQSSSPNQMPNMAGPLGNSTTPTRWTGSLQLSDRTVAGYPNLLVGPGITIMRSWSIYPADRTIQSASSSVPPEPAEEFLNQRSFIGLKTPALQWNITGKVRKLTATEEAVWYTNILLTRESDN